MKKRYESKWEGPGYYRVWQRRRESIQPATLEIAYFNVECEWNVRNMVYRKIELPPEPKPVIEFEPGLYRVRLLGGEKWYIRKRRANGKSYDIGGVEQSESFDTTYSAYQKLEPGEIIETK
jgi:hypothetical protein